MMIRKELPKIPVIAMSGGHVNTSLYLDLAKKLGAATDAAEAIHVRTIVCSARGRVGPARLLGQRRSPVKIVHSTLLMPQSNQSRSLLVVDDDLPLRRSIESALRNAGHKVIGTCGRDEVLALLESKQFDLVITDMLMPDLEGTEVVKAVKASQPDAAIIVMSGGGIRMTPELCLAAARTMGAGMPLIKPFELGVLMSRRAALGSQMLPTQKHRATGLTKGRAARRHPNPPCGRRPQPITFNGSKM